MLRLVRLVPAWRVCKHRLAVSIRGVFSFSSHLFNTKNEIKPNSLLLFNNNNNVVCRGLSQWSKSDAARNHRNNVIRDLKSVEEILAMFEKEGSKYEYQNLVNSLHKISKVAKARDRINVKDRARVKVLERAAFRKINEMRARGLSNYIYSLVDLNFITIEKETWESINQNLIKEAKDFIAQDISNTVYALGKLGNRNEEVFKAIASKIKLTNLKDLDAQSISNTLYGFALADLDNKNISNEVFASFSKEILNRDLKSFNEQNLSNIVWSFATLEIKDGKLFESFAKHIVTRELKEFKPQGISNTLYAFALTKIDNRINKPLFEAFSKHILKERDLKSLKGQEISNIVWSFATLEINDENLFESFVKHILTRDLKEFKPQEISNTLYAYALAKVDDKINKPLFDAFSKHILKDGDLNSFKKKEISNIIQCFATLEIKDENLFEVLHKHVGARDLKEFIPQELSIKNVATQGLALRSESNPSPTSLLNDRIKDLVAIEEILAMFEKEGSKYDYQNLVNSLHKISKLSKSRGKLKMKDHTGVKVLERAAFRKINEMRARQLSNYIYSLVDLNFITIEKETWEVINRNLIKKAKDFIAQNISNTVYALGKLGNRNEEVFQAIANKIKATNLKDFKGQAICNTLHGFALADLDNKNISKDIFASFSKEILNRDLKSFNEQDIAIIVWSFATLEIKDEKLFGSFAKHIVSRDLIEFKPQGICNTLYAYALAKLDNEINKPLFEAFSKHILKERDLNSFNQNEISSIIRSFTSLTIKNNKLFEFFGKHVVTSNLKGFNPQERLNNPRAKDKEAPSSSNSIFAAGNEHGNKNMEMFKAITPIIESSSVEAFNAKDKGVSVWDESDKGKIP